MVKHSIKKRYFVTLLTNIFKLLSGLITASLVPRSLGPSDYGSFNFLLSSFASIRGVLNLSTQSAFLTHNSKSLECDHISVFYALFLVCQLALLIALLYFCKVTETYQLFWPGQEGKYIWAIAIFEFIFFVSSQLIAFGDVKGLTVHVRLISVVFYFANLLLIVILFLKGRLTLNTFITARYIVTLLFVASLCYYFLRLKKDLFSKIDFNSLFRLELVGESAKYYHNFCKPLVFLSIFGLGATYFERWFLQHIYGSAEQGYYSISLRLTSIILIFTTSIINIFWKEITGTFEKGDMDKVGNLYRDITFSLYGMSCLIAMFVFYHSHNIMAVLAGPEFRSAGIVMMIMALYPIHQTFGQLNSVFLIATGRANLYKKIGIFSHTFGLVLIYFLLAPSNYIIPGLNLASVGFAVRMVVAQFIFVNVQIYYICKMIRSSYIHLLFRQLYIIVYFGLVGLFSKNIINVGILALGGLTNGIYALLLHGAIYVFVSLSILSFYPSLCGFREDDVAFIFAEARKLFKSIA